MRRSEINEAIRYALTILEASALKLPAFGYWNPKQWSEKEKELDNLTKIMLGWDVTDFGSGDFQKTGAVLFTIRNGYLPDSSYGTPYAEKLILLRHETGQGLPIHCHRQKTEDIINRGGGIMEMQLYGSSADGSPDPNASIFIRMDGILRKVNPGEMITVEKGCSVTLTPGIYHRFRSKPGCGDLVVGEVSSINDDKADNYFVEDRPRFTEIQEDEEPLYLLCNEYGRIMRNTLKQSCK